jgi:hypothetical protein
MNLLQEPYEMLIHAGEAGIREKESRSQKEV